MARLHRISFHPVSDPTRGPIERVASTPGIEQGMAEELVRTGGVVLTAEDRGTVNNVRNELSELGAQVSTFTFDQEANSALRGRVVASLGGVGSVEVMAQAGPKVAETDLASSSQAAGRRSREWCWRETSASVIP